MKRKFSYSIGEMNRRLLAIGKPIRKYIVISTIASILGALSHMGLMGFARYGFWRPPSSALDALHEKELLHTLQTEYTGKTLILISHRSSTLTGCNRLLKMGEAEG